MNETVENLFTQMFAPEPIPDKVKDIHDRALRFGNRIDMPKMSVSNLVLIAAIGSSGEIPIQKPKVPLEAEIDLNEDDEPELASEIDDSGETSAKLEPGITAGPTGPMDAPVHPEDVNIGRTEEYLKRLEPAELRAHAREFYRWNAPPNMSKKKLIAGILKIKPLKEGFNEAVKKAIEQE